MREASSIDELKPLLALCRAGRLFEVQEWIRQGNPVALPEGARARAAAQHNPLRIAMDAGFHSLVQVLLEAGARPREGRYNALEHAVEQRRPDLASLLILHGAKISDVSMRLVIEMWQSAMLELFLANGASLTRDKPIAWGLIHRTRPTLGLLKRFCSEQPELMRQADLALRSHAREGHAKGVALLLWAGADPWARGPDGLDELNDGHDEDAERGLNAIELAMCSGHHDILRQKKLLTALNQARSEQIDLLETACHAPDSQALALLLERGYSPKLLPDRGTRAISSILHSMSWEALFTRPGEWTEVRSRGIDTTRARERMRMLHMLVAAGAKWLPGDKRSISEARRCLLKMAPEYVLEFVWLMQGYGAGRRRDVEELLRTMAMIERLSGERERASALVARIPEELPLGC